MAGYTPLTLNLTPLPNSNLAMIVELFKILENKFQFQYDIDTVRKLITNPSTGDWYPKEIKQKYDRLDKLAKEQKHFWVSGEILFDELVIWIEIKLLPDATDQEIFIVTIQLESKAYDAIYCFDLTANNFDEEAKSYLTDFCVSAANALGAEGFILSFTSGQLQSPEVETVKTIVSDLINATRNQVGLINGIQIKLLDESAIKKAENSKISYQLNGYLILNTIQPFDI